MAIKLIIGLALLLIPMLKLPMVFSLMPSMKGCTECRISTTSKLKRYIVGIIVILLEVGIVPILAMADAPISWCFII